MLKRTASLILTFITLLSLLSIAITPVSATEEISNTTHENVDDSNWTLYTRSPEFYDSETQEPITSPVLPQQVSEAPITTQPIVTIPPTIVIIKPTSPITSPVIIYPTGVPIVSINTTSVITQPIISTEPSNNTVVIATDPTEEINPPLSTEPVEKLSTTINVSKSSEGKYKVSANATGGSGYYEYQFLVNNTLYQDFSDKNQCTFMLTTNGNYNFKVIVKDSTGNTISTDTTIVVTIDSENTTEHIESTYPSIPIIKPTETKITIPVLDFSSDPTTTTTQAETTTTYVEKGLLGDVTIDGKVNIRDATAIQKHLAKIKLLSDDALLLADFDQNEKLNIKDATSIQKFIAGLIDNGTHTHKYNKTVIPPTCTEKGYTIYECSCGDSYKDDLVDTKNHNFVDRICSECGAKEIHKHSYSAFTVAPTCTKKGYTEYTCSCGDKYFDNWTTSYGNHNFENYECTSCGVNPFDYYVEWIKENGYVYGDHYVYDFNSVYEIEGFDNYKVYVNYYPEVGDIALTCFDKEYHESTMIFLYENEANVTCIYGGNDYRVITDIHIPTYTSDTPITPTECNPGPYVELQATEYARLSINLTLSLHRYAMLAESLGITIEDLGFYSY